MHCESFELNALSLLLLLLLLLYKQTKDLENYLVHDNFYITVWDHGFILLVINYTVFFTSGFTNRKLM